MISTAGGVYPRWRRDGKEIVYLSEVASGGKLMSADVSANGTFKAGPPKELFSVPITRALGVEGQAWNWDMSPDGQRFLINTAVEASDNSPISVVTDWTELLKR